MLLILIAKIDIFLEGDGYYSNFAATKLFPMKYDVFVSYSRKDTKIVDEFVNRLEAEGIRVWIDRDGIESGDAFKRVIVNAIKESALFIFFSSVSSNASPWTTKEVSIAVHYDKSIIPIKIDRTIYNEDIEFDLVNLDYIDYTEESLRQPMMDKLVRTIKSKLPRREENVVTDTEVKPQTEARECTLVAPKSVSLVQNTPAKKEGKKSKKVLWIVLGLLVVLALAALAFKLLDSREKQSEISSVALEDLTFNVKGVAFVMKPVVGEAFVMGGTDDNPARQDSVGSFYMGETEVTQALWVAVMGDELPRKGAWNDGLGLGDNYPVYQISWDEIQTFLNKLNALTNKYFRLPTDAEWEFAARGGAKANGYVYSGSNHIDDVAWYNKNSGNTTHEVKQLKPNELGLYDMSGNVWEWCSGLYNDDATNASMHVLRGGGWNRNVDRCLVTFRGKSTPDFKGDSHGFRLALSL